MQRGKVGISWRKGYDFQIGGEIGMDGLTASNSNSHHTIGALNIAIGTGTGTGRIHHHRHTTQQSSSCKSMMLHHSAFAGWSHRVYSSNQDLVEVVFRLWQVNPLSPNMNMIDIAPNLFLLFNTLRFDNVEECVGGVVSLDAVSIGHNLSSGMRIISLSLNDSFDTRRKLIW